MRFVPPLGELVCDYVVMSGPRGETCLVCLIVDSLWPDDAIWVWEQRSLLTSVQLMDCHLVVLPWTSAEVLLIVILCNSYKMGYLQHISHWRHLGFIIFLETFQYVIVNGSQARFVSITLLKKLCNCTRARKTIVMEEGQILGNPHVWVSKNIKITMYTWFIGCRVHWLQIKQHFR